MPAAGRQPVDVPGVHLVAGQRPALPSQIHCPAHQRLPITRRVRCARRGTALLRSNRSMRWWTTVPAGSPG
ncbi:hypothetical protein C9412_09935 [Stenotrophomonas sp. Nf1]|nr:hypothetical protein C9412_09935 [Stenotrophomonas sp. Nf1]PTA81483.1 hypothetical protein C9416_07485 [Stenotrophomonas sp. Nf4]